MGKSKKQGKKAAKFVGFCRDKKLLTKFEKYILAKNKEVEEKQIELNEVELQITTINSNITHKRLNLKRKSEELCTLKQEIVSKKKKLTKPSFKISSKQCTQRKNKPTEKNSNKRTLDLRRAELFNAATSINGATEENHTPALYGLYGTLCAKFPAKEVYSLVLNGKKAIVKSLKTTILKSNFENYQHSEENISRSLSVYYSHNVMGKEKYLSLRKVNETMSTQVNYVLYPLLATTINNIDIGILHDIHPSLT